MSMVEIKKKKKKKKKRGKNSRIGKKAEIRGNAENFHVCICFVLHGDQTVVVNPCISAMSIHQTRIQHNNKNKYRRRNNWGILCQESSWLWKQMKFIVTRQYKFVVRIRTNMFYCPRNSLTKTGLFSHVKWTYTERQKKLITSSEWHSLKSKASTWIIFGHRLGKFVLNKHM